MSAKRKNWRDEEMQRICERWNAANPVGTPVKLEKDSGALVDTKTRSEAYVCESGYPVCFFEGVSGYYLLARATPTSASEHK
jgi:hypothetical protein